MEVRDAGWASEKAVISRPINLEPSIDTDCIGEIGDDDARESEPYVIETEDDTTS